MKSLLFLYPPTLHPYPSLSIYLSLSLSHSIHLSLSLPLSLSPFLHLALSPFQSPSLLLSHSSTHPLFLWPLSSPHHLNIFFANIQVRPLHPPEGRQDFHLHRQRQPVLQPLRRRDTAGGEPRALRPPAGRADLLAEVRRPKVEPQVLPSERHAGHERPRCATSRACHAGGAGVRPHMHWLREMNKE